MNKPVVAVGAIVFKDDCVLLVKRKNEPAKEQWAIPGGKVQFGETLKQAVEREILEETSIEIEAGQPSYVFEYINEHHYIIIDLDAKYIAGEPKANDDALEAKWISAKEIMQLNVADSSLKLLQQKYNFV